MQEFAVVKLGLSSTRRERDEVWNYVEESRRAVGFQQEGEWVLQVRKRGG
ncbi:hypothetical protein ABKV19_006331 [Rosa sericea]